MDRGLLLLSGGIDSPVAGDVVQRQGVDLASVHFSLEPWTDDVPELKSRKLADALDLGPVTVVSLDEASAVLARAEHRLYFVLSKRLMLRVADRIADEQGRGLLVTGENLGQVSSQTLENLAVIDAAVDRPVVRPLLGWDKVEIVDEAKAIGTYEVAKGPEHCDALGPTKPSTRAELAAVEAVEAEIDVDGLVEASLARATA